MNGEPSQPLPPPTFSPRNGPTWPPGSPSAAQTPMSPASTTSSFTRKPPPPMPEEEPPRSSFQSGRSSSSSDRSPPARPSVLTPPRPSINGQASPASALRTSLNGKGSPGSSTSRPAPTRLITRKSVVDNKRTSTAVNTRNELLISLLASEAMVDSRDFEILSSEDVEELKKEQQSLSTKFDALNKKLVLETKIRDAAVSLGRVGASQKAGSKQPPPDQLEEANRRVEAAQKEVWRVSERLNEVRNRLLEHRAGVLSYSVRTMEKKISPGSNGTAVSAATQPRFDGAHLFAGHADSVRFLALEEKLKEATEALGAAGKKQVAMSRELQMLKLEKQEVETMMGMDLQSAEDTIASLQEEIPKIEQLDAERSALLEEKSTWETDRQSLLKKIQENNSAAQSQGLEDMQRQWEAEREEWERERTEMQDEKMEDLARLQEEMDTIREEDDATIQNLNQELSGGLAVVRQLIQTHAIEQYSRDPSLKGLVTSIGQHITNLQNKLDSQEAWATERETMSRELQDAQTELARIKTRSPSSLKSPGSAHFSNDLTGDSGRVVSILQPIWAILPSPETRAAKFGNQSKFRTGSPPVPASPGSAGANATLPVRSLSDLDVRSLKTLYAPSAPPSPNISAFSLENFAIRVQALIQDDRALIERLVRFAQAHELLKKNAERAQKLAQESNSALETYQKQVKALEQRNLTLAAQQTAVGDEGSKLQATIDRLIREKSEIEASGATQAEVCKQLTEANNVLSAKTLALAEEAAAAPEMTSWMRIRTAEQSQRIALLDELNTMQTENGQLRAQLRAAKKT
ncbi:Up-regulated during septation-domain-containing protein [Mycena floridula]|nr:Up-regulated during septation-domain-containing protein [Mycena floridula]